MAENARIEKELNDKLEQLIAEVPGLGSIKELGDIMKSESGTWKEMLEEIMEMQPGPKKVRLANMWKQTCPPI